MEEVFKDIVGYEGLYKVSNTGKVYSLISGKVLQTTKRKASQTSYEYLTLVKDKVKQTYTVHRLVAKQFIPNTDNKPIVNHIDNNGLNNNVSNLEWCTYSENLKHAQNQGRLFKAQSKGGQVTTQIAQDLAKQDALAMVGTTIQNWKIGNLVGKLPIGRRGVERYTFECSCTDCGDTKPLTREYLYTLKAKQCRKCSGVKAVAVVYEKAKAVLENTQINNWKILSLTKPTSGIRSCKAHAQCIECGSYTYIPYAAIQINEIKKCVNCK